MIKKIRLVIADDHPMVIEGLANYFSAYDEIEVIATTNKISEIVKMVSILSPDILLMDYHFINEELTGLDICSEILVKYPCTKVIIISSFDDVSLIKKFIEVGPEDFSISRLASKMPWGIAVPDDAEHVMYVWFDALTNYISAIGYPDDTEKFNDWWPGIQVAGKDNLRQQSAMWQAMLMAVKLPPSKQVFINSFLTSGGQKMSKSLGNVISPDELVDKFSTDGARYLLASWNSFGEDIDITWENLTEKYNAELANGLGNLVSRVFRLAENYSSVELRNRGASGEVLDFTRTINEAMEGLRFSEAIEKIKAKIDWANKHIDETKLWDLVKTDKEKAGKVLEELLGIIVAVGESLESIMPETAGKILAGARAEKIVKGEGLFPRTK